jgi:DNA repair protein RadC
MHKHPNNTIQPSEEDEIFTDELVRISRKFGLKFVDHLIIGVSGYYSIMNKMKK